MSLNNGINNLANRVIDRAPLASRGDTDQLVNITDLICEGPIKGLVAGGSSIYLNDVPIQEEGFSPVNSASRGSAVEGSITFNGSSNTGTVNTDLPTTILSGYVRTLTIKDYLTSESIDISIGASDNTINISSANFSSSEWNTSEGPFSNFKQVELYTEGHRVMGNLTVTSPTTAIFTGYTDLTNVGFDFATSNAYSIKLHRRFYVQNLNASTNAITITNADNIPSGTYSFALSEPFQVNVNTETIDFDFPKIEEMSWEFRDGSLFQEPYSEFGSVGGSVSISGDLSDVNLPNLRQVKGTWAAGEGIQLYSSNGYPEGQSSEVNGAADATYLPASTAFNLSSAQIQEVDEVSFGIRYPSLQTLNLESGNKEPAYAFYRIEISTDNGPWRNCFPNYGNHVIHSGDTNAPVNFDHVIGLAQFRPFNDFTIRIVRVTRDVGLPVVSDGTAGGRTDRSKWNLSAQASISQISSSIKDNFSYPYSAGASISFSSKKFDNVPKRSYLLQGKKVRIPTTYTPREYSETGEAVYQGFWNGTFKNELYYTDNPAWVFYDIVTNNRYGAGKYISPEDIDIYSLYRISKYCDELVPSGEKDEFGQDILEPRFRSNIFLTKASDVYKVLKDMASMFTAVIYWLDGKMTLVQDTPSDPIYTFTKGNVIEGRFEYESTGTKARPNQIVVTWNDPDFNYEPVPLIVEDREDIVRRGKIVSQTAVAFGATSRGQATRYGRWKLWTGLNQTEIVNFRTALQGMYIKPGDVVNIQDADRYSVQYSGRISSYNQSSGTLILDREVFFNPDSSYELSVVVTAPAAFYSGYATATINGEQYTKGDRIAGVLTEEEATSLEDDSGNPVSITWKPYTYVEKVNLLNPGESTNTLNVSLDSSEVVGNEGIWALKETQSTGDALGSLKQYKVISISQQGKAEFSISAVEYYEEKFDAVDSDYTLGETPTSVFPTEEGPVPAPLNLYIRVDTDATRPGEELTLQWDAPEDYRFIAGYEINHSLPGLPNPITVSDTSYSFNNVPNGMQVFRVRTVSSKGNVSTYTSVRYDVNDPYGSDVPRIAGGIPKGIVSNSQIVVKTDSLSNPEAVISYLADNPRGFSIANTLTGLNTSTSLNTIDLTGISDEQAREDNIWYWLLYDGGAHLGYRDTSSLKDLPYMRKLPAGGWRGSPQASEWIDLGSGGNLFNVNKYVGFNTRFDLFLEPGDIVIFDDPSLILKRFYLSDITLNSSSCILTSSDFNPALGTGHKVIIDKTEGLSNINKNSFYVKVISDTERQLYFDADLKSPVTNADITGNWTSDGYLQVVDLDAARVMAVEDATTILLDRRFPYTKNSNIYKYYYKPDYIDDAVFGRVKWLLNTEEEDLPVFSLEPFIVLDPELGTGASIIVSTSTPTILYSGDESTQLTNITEISATATAIGFSNPEFKLSNLSGGLEADLDEEWQDPNVPGGFDYSVVVDSDGEVPFDEGSLGVVTISVREKNNPGVNAEGEGYVVKTLSGSDGINGRSVFLEAEDYTVIYDESGRNPIHNGLPFAITFSSTAQNFNSPEFRFTFIGTTLASTEDFFLAGFDRWSETSFAFVDPPDEYEGNWGNNKDQRSFKVRVEVREQEDPLTILAVDEVSVLGVHSLKGGYWVSLSNEAHTISTDSTGVPNQNPAVDGFVVSENSGTTIEVGKGSDILSFVPPLVFSELTPESRLGKYTVTISESPADAIDRGELDFSDRKLISFSDHGFSTTIWTQDNAAINYEIQLEDTDETITRSQTFSKSKAGFGGISVTQSNPFESVSTNGFRAFVEITSNDLNVIVAGLSIPFYVNDAAASSAGASTYWTLSSYVASGVIIPESSFSEFNNSDNNGTLGPVSQGPIESFENSLTEIGSIDYNIKVVLAGSDEIITARQTLTKTLDFSNISMYASVSHYNFDADGGTSSPATGYTLYWITKTRSYITPVVVLDGDIVSGSSKNFIAPSYDEGAPIIHEIKLYDGTPEAGDENLLDVDTVTISKSQSAANNVILELSNDTTTVGGTEGEALSDLNISSTLSVFVGGELDTSNWTISASVSAGITGTLVGSTYSISGLSSEFESGSVTFVAEDNLLRYSSQQKIFTITKVNNGQNGISYSITSNTSAVIYDPNTEAYSGGGGASNNEVTFSFFKIEGGSSVPFSGQYSINGGPLQGPASSTTAIALTSGQISCSLYSEDGNALLDSESVPIINGGVDGDPGPSGSDGGRRVSGIIYNTTEAPEPTATTYNFNAGTFPLSNGWTFTPATQDTTQSVIYYMYYTAVEQVDANGNALGSGPLTFGDAFEGTNFSGVVTFTPASGDFDIVGESFTSINGGQIRTNTIEADRLTIGETGKSESRLLLLEDSVKIFEGTNLRVHLGNLNNNTT